jgi:hypothetical protein
MKRLFFSLSILTTLALVFSGCQTEEKRELKGYKFIKENARTSEFSVDELSGSISVDMFIMLHSYPTKWTTIVSKLQSDSNNEFHLRIKNKDYAQWYYGDGKKAIVLDWKSESVLPLNQWVRLTAVRDRSKKTMELFANGQSVAKKTYKVMPKPVKTGAGINFMAYGKSSLDATVADVRIWSKALTPSDINKTAGIIKKADKMKDLVAYWNFEFVENGIARDLAGKNLDATIKKVK